MRRIVIMGAGPGGLCAGKRLKDQGYDNFIILEQAPRLGGTWWHNQYPGCRCDVPSQLYSFSFAPKLDWSEPYASRAEILAYLEDCAERFGLLPHVRLNAPVESATWDEASGTWAVRTTHSETYTADILISAVGLFNVPAYPRLEGFDRFTGSVMHSARWNHAIDLSGKSVSVIGSAASAVQLVPEIAKVVSHLTVFQRTPNYVSPRGSEFSTEFIEHAKTDAHAANAAERERMAGWLDAVCTLDQPAVMAEMAAACEKNRAQVTDPALRKKLTPQYPFGSKRGLVSSDWYPTFNRDNVTLVTERIDRLVERGVVVEEGVVYPSDIIVLATGFETTKFLSAIPIYGRDHLPLNTAWAKGAHAYLGITTHHFPNLFMLYGPNTNNGSIISQLECQVDYIVRKLLTMDRRAWQWIDINDEHERRFNETLQADLAKVGVWQAGVSDYYRSDSGLIVTQWPHTMARYRFETQRDDNECYDYATFDEAALRGTSLLDNPR
jgi:cation diffusion facilitator CzcD-associated flavoprotein CzcO